MIDPNIILAKTTTIKRCLKRIGDVTQYDLDKLENFDTQDIFVLNLQRAVQAAIDLASHINASENRGITQTIKENFDLLHQDGIIDDDLTEHLKSMVGFRNIAVHDYMELDLNVLKAILKSNLDDLEVFSRIILKKFIQT